MKIDGEKLDKLERAMNSWRIISDEFTVLIELEDDLAAVVTLIAEKARLDAMLEVFKKQFDEIRRGMR